MTTPAMVPRASLRRTWGEGLLVPRPVSGEWQKTLRSSCRLAPALDATGIRFPTVAVNWSIDFIETMTFKALSQGEEAT